MPEAVIVGTFSDEETLMRAVASVRRERLRIHDVFAPYPVHGLDDAMGIRRTRLPFVSLGAGLFGAAVALLFQIYANVLDWPLDVGGKPSNSILAFIPVAFELTVLCSGLATVFAFLIRSRLYPGKREWLAGPGVTDGSFALALRYPDTFLEALQIRKMLLELGALSVEERTASGTSTRLRAGLVGLVLLGIACSSNDHPGYEYMPDMARGPAFEAFAPNPATRDGLTLQRPVPRTIARGRPPFHYGPGEEEAMRAGRELANPLRATQEILAEGKGLYGIYCLVCHGEQGTGDGPLAGKIPAPPSYRSERVMGFAAGRIFHVVTMGSGKMPPYAAQLDVNERWAVATYVRASLQGLVESGP